MVGRMFRQEQRFTDNKKEQRGEKVKKKCEGSEKSAFQKSSMHAR